MISYSLNIAGYRILFQSATEKLRPVPSHSQVSFMTPEREFDVAVNISRGKWTPGLGAEMVFRAPYVEEINGVAVKKSDRFWTVYKHGDYILIHTTLPLSDTMEEALLTVRPGEKGWDLLVNTDAEELNPLEYPLDGLLIYYLTALNGDIFIHGSGVEYNSRGYLFTGSSGSGKTTIASIFEEAGARIIHDDRLVIRKDGKGYMMHNTPVYSNERRLFSRLDNIFIISHSPHNRIAGKSSIEALTSVMANSIQHHWNSNMIGTLTAAIMDLTAEVKVNSLGFVPDNSVIEFIEYEQGRS